ncbi:hypothetical protein BRM3_08835 [Brachybacterium huguangmaarense]|uniref:DNA-binding protein n=1 Tax=Brachybacterium huguangmaarense TaxID=1652028 RepID=A0ABY6FXU1_9MICO|nr:hypothetical protein [Brachybacterium huguangmaarense]UYG15749.1 hypothetical protein BRM3_08835 [Brachybacterium huguangmaarense]
MTAYEVNLILHGVSLDDERQMKALEELPYVALPASIHGAIELEVEIEAGSAIDAWARINADVNAIGGHIARIGLDLVSTSDIAERLGASRESVRLWSAGKRRDHFPAPFDRISASPIWRWVEVYEWASKNGVCLAEELPHPLPADMVDALNGALARWRYAKRNEGWSRGATRGRVIPIEHGRRNSLRVRYQAQSWVEKSVAHA